MVPRQGVQGWTWLEFLQLVVYDILISEDVTAGFMKDEDLQDGEIAAADLGHSTTLVAIPIKSFDDLVQKSKDNSSWKPKDEVGGDPVNDK